VLLSALLLAPVAALPLAVGPLLFGPTLPVVCGLLLLDRASDPHTDERAVRRNS
jgi:hypothetical protein